MKQRLLLTLDWEKPPSNSQSKESCIVRLKIESINTMAPKICGWLAIHHTQIKE
jgi:hypothetical protein